LIHKGREGRMSNRRTRKKNQNVVKKSILTGVQDPRRKKLLGRRKKITATSITVKEKGGGRRKNRYLRKSKGRSRVAFDEWQGHHALLERKGREGAHNEIENTLLNSKRSGGSKSS